MTHIRRALLRSAAFMTVVLALSGCTALDTASALLGHQVSFSAAQLQRYLDQRQPRQYDQLGGLVSLNVTNPQLSIPPDSTRLHLDFDVGVDGFGMDGDKPAGHFAIVSGLRYDIRSHALYLEEPELESAELPLVGSRMNATGRDLINAWLRDYARNEPVYRLEQDTLEKLGSRRVAGTLIQNGRVVIKLDR
jgi:hypothetical protein